MGSKGSKPRKPRHSQPLPKVGTTTENERLLHEEQDAVLHQMGLSEGASSGAKIALIAIIVIIVVGAIFALLAVTILH
jgi:hypothetical protein